MTGDNTVAGGEAGATEVVGLLTLKALMWLDGFGDLLLTKRARDECNPGSMNLVG